MGLGIMSLTHIFSWYRLEEKRINYRDYKLYVVLLVYIVLMATNLSFINNFFRVVVTTIISILANYYLMGCSLKQTILMPLMTQIVIMLAESSLALLLSSFDVNLTSIADAKFGEFLLDTVISIIVILVYLLCDFLPKTYQKIVRETDKIDYEYFGIFSIVIIFIANILGATTYYKIDFKYLILLNTLLTIVYFVIIIRSFLNRNNYLKVSDKYNTTLSSLREYEDILGRYKVSNHENKNQLMIIRNMVKSNEKNVPDYIDKVIENNLQDNEQLMMQSAVIPEGGLRGLIYAKLLLMKAKNIDCDLSIDKAIKTVQLIELGEQNLLDICKIVGVFLDNAIEAVENLEEKFIDLEMSIEGKKLYISVTNNFIGTIDLDSIEEMGATTKGNGHGYGLPLVKTIIEKNRLLKNEKQVSSDEFSQRLVINISKLKLKNNKE